MGYFLMGLGVGFGCGMLFAPKSGHDTRDYLWNKAEEGKDYVKQRGGELRHAAEDLVERGKHALHGGSRELSHQGEKVYGTR
jgi:gas vesicle protein